MLLMPMEFLRMGKTVRHTEEAGLGHCPTKGLVQNPGDVKEKRVSVAGLPLIKAVLKLVKSGLGLKVVLTVVQ